MLWASLGLGQQYIASNRAAPGSGVSVIRVVCELSLRPWDTPAHVATHRGVSQRPGRSAAFDAVVDLHDALVWMIAWNSAR